MNFSFKELKEKLKEIIRGKEYNEKKKYGKDRTIIFIMIISSSFTTILFLLGVLTLTGILYWKEAILTGFDFIVLAVLSAIGPLGFYIYLKNKHKRQIEEQLPDFLREISSSTSSGMTIYDAVHSAARGDHGKLTPEIKMMSSQLSWGISIKDALNNLANRINTNAVKRMAITVNKALEIGGNTSVVFDAAAKEIDQIKQVEYQRRTEMSLYSIVIFISFFVFLAVVLIINGTIFAEFIKLQPQMQGQAIGGMEITTIDPEMLKLTFLSFVMVQSIGGGILGGFMMDGKASSGVRFAFILVLVSFFAFKFLF